MTTRSVRGRVRGGSIELADDLGLVDGQEVEVIVQVRQPEQVWGEGLRNSAGGMAAYWTPEDDEILAEIARGRQRPSGREIPE